MRNGNKRNFQMINNPNEKSTKQVVLPPYIAVLLGEPPILPTEERAVYESIFSEIANQIEPKPIFEWLWVRDLTDLIWEIRRLRWQKTLILEAASKPALKALLKSTEVCTVIKSVTECDEEEIFADKLWRSPEERAEVYDRLAKYGLDAESIAAQAFVMRQNEIRIIDMLIERAERRRDRILREIGSFREATAELLELTRKLIDEKPDVPPQQEAA
jgi:hypothetical protein